MSSIRGQAATFAFAILVGLFAVAAMAATAYHLITLRDGELRRLQDIASAHARVFDGDLTQSLNVVELGLRNIAESDMASPALAWTLGRALRNAPHLRSLSLLGADDVIVASSNPANVGRRPALASMLPEGSAAASALRIGLPWSGRDFADGRPTTPERPGTRDGLGFVPVVLATGTSTRVLAAVNPDYFINRFLQTLPASEGAIEVLRLDRLLLFTTEDSPEAPLPGGTRRLAALPEAGPDAADAGVAQGKSSSGILGVTAYRSSRQFPVAVVVRLDATPALKSWRKQSVALLAVLVPAFGLTVWLAFVAFRRVQHIERQRQEEELRAHDRLAGRVFEASAEAIVVTDADNRIVRVNPAYTRLSGYSEAEAIGQTPRINRSEHHDKAFYDALWKELLARGTWKGEIINRRKDGESYPVMLTISAVRDGEGEIANFVALLTDISERKAREDRIRFLSEHDFLTGLPNRALFQDRVARAIAHARRARNKVGVLFVDLDRFKPINDTYGHHVGDQLLQEIGRRLVGTIRESDTVGRQGGDEFLVMVTEAEDPQDIARIAEKIMSAVSAPCAIAGHSLQVTPSIGISVFPDDGGTLEELIRAADTAMYHSKSQGRAAYHFFSATMNDEADARLALEVGLRRALEQRLFRLHYQPLTDLASGATVGVEALLRWSDDELGDVPPSTFIPVAEESGLILAIGDWVLDEACRQLRCWIDQGLPPMVMAINVSPAQFARSGFVAGVLRVLARYGLQGESLELEVTEGMLIRNDATRAAEFAALREAGIRLAIDDFGTGYSSLSYLRQLPVDKIKIDRSFIADVAGNSESALIVGALIDMAHGIGLRVLGEGVETREQYDFLRARGCDDVQGFLVSRPLPAEAFAAWLAATGARRGFAGTGRVVPAG